ncbi:MAG: Wzy polymerase domain-containing protein [Burkholderiales bacterium]
MAILDHSDRPNFLRASVLLTGLAWTLPFLQPYHRYPLTGFYSEWLAFALGLAAALVLLSRQAWRGAELPAVAMAPVGLAVVLGVQAALERVPYPEQVLTAVLYLLWASLLVLLGSVLRRALGMTTVATTLAWFLFASGILSAAIGLLQHFHAPTPVDFLIGRGPAQRVFGNLGQPNHYAAHLTLALASAGYLYACRRLHGALAGGCIALSLLVLAITGARSTWLFLGALTVLAMLLHARRRDSGSRRLAIAAGWLLPGFVIALAVTTLPFMAPPDHRLLTSMERLFQVATGIGPRLQIWYEAWQMFLGAPLLGAGWGQFAWHHFVHQAVTGETAAPGVFNHAHNIVLQLMAETGAVGASIVVGALVLWIADLKRVKFELEGWWLLALAAVIAIHSLLEYPLWYSYFLGMAALLLGLGAERVFALRFAGAARAAAGLAIITGWLNLIAMLPSYVEFERLVFTPESRSAQLLDEAAFAKALVGLYREPMLVPYVELAVAYGITPSKEKLTEKLELTARAVHFAPESVVTYRYALLLALAGRAEAAREQFVRALRVYPEQRSAVIAELESLARRYPAELTPLLELATSNFAERRVSQEGK